jgi:hypothetical protein
MRCVKNCPNSNIRFSLRPFLRGLWRSPKRTVAGTFAVIVLLGIVIGEVGEEWEVVDNIILAVPTAVAEFTGIEQILVSSTGSGFLIWEALWMFVVLPFLILSLGGVVAWVFSRKYTPLEYVRTYALAFVPIILSLHLAKLVTAFEKHGASLPGALSDPNGQSTADAIAAGSLVEPTAFLSSQAVWGWLMVALVVGLGLLGGLYTTWRISRVSFAGDSAVGVKTAIPFALVLMGLSAVFVLTIYNWLVVAGG